MVSTYGGATSVIRLLLTSVSNPVPIELTKTLGLYRQSWVSRSNSCDPIETVSASGCSVNLYRHDSLRSLSRSIRRSLYEYTMCKHKDLRFLWEGGWALVDFRVLTLKLANHASHQRWLVQKAGRSMWISSESRRFWSVTLFDRASRKSTRTPKL